MVSVIAYLPIRPDNARPIIADLGTMILCILSLVWLVRFLLRDRAVDSDTIFAALSGYLAIGFMGSVLAGSLERTVPGSFIHTSDPSAQVDLDYFSYVTLSTLGYGDIVPLTDQARSLSVFIAVFGQLYLTVVVAILVGKFLARKTV